HETKIVDAESGTDLTGKLAVNYGAAITLGDVITARLEVVLARLDLVPNRVEWQTRNPATGRLDPVSSITFRDGSRVDLGEDGSVKVLGPDGVRLEPEDEMIECTALGDPEPVHIRAPKGGAA